MDLLAHDLYYHMLTLVGQRMEIRLMRLDGDDSRGQYIEVYLSIYIRNKKKVHNLKMKESEDD